MEQIGVIGSGNSVNFKKKLISFFKGTEKVEKSKKEFNSIKDRFEVNNEFLNRKPSLQKALIDCGPTIFIDSPLKDVYLENLLFEFSVRYDSFNEKLENIEIKPNKKIKNWKEYLEKFENPKTNDFFTILENGNLKLAEEGLIYLKSVISKYEVAVA